MKRHLHFIPIMFLAGTFSALGQGTFVYDQQSSDESHYMEGSAGLGLQPGQSFTPALPSVGFIRLYLYDGFRNGLSGTLNVNLRSDSITGPVLSSAIPVTLPDGFAGTVDFLFSTPVSVTPGELTFFNRCS